MSRKTAITAAAAAAALAVAGAAYSSHADEAPAGRDAVWGGGHFVNRAGGPRDLSVLAMQGGVGGANGSLIFGSNGVTTINRTEVMCVAVDGNTAVVGGIIRETNTGALVGSANVMYYIDNGGPESSTRDLVSPILIFFPEEVEELMPPGFPHVCPEPTLLPGFSYLDLTEGDIVVHDAPGSTRTSGER